VGSLSGVVVEALCQGWDPSEARPAVTDNGRYVVFYALSPDALEDLKPVTKGLPALETFLVLAGLERWNYEGFADL